MCVWLHDVILKYSCPKLMRPLESITSTTILRFEIARKKNAHTPVVQNLLLVDCPCRPISLFFMFFVILKEKLIPISKDTLEVRL